MKCPHCATPIGLFSPEMKTLGRTRTCPHCGQAVVMGILPLRFTLGFAAVTIPAIALGMNSSIAAGVAGGVGALVGMGLKPGKR